MGLEELAPQLGLPGVTDASLTDLLFERDYVIGRSLIDSWQEYYRLFT